jgi:hypothetical protein
MGKKEGITKQKLPSIENKNRYYLPLFSIKGSLSGTSRDEFTCPEPLLGRNASQDARRYRLTVQSVSGLFPRLAKP